MSTKPVSIGTLKKGDSVVIDGAACRVTNVSTSRPGKHGHAKVRMEGVGIIDSKKRVIVSPGHDNVDVPIIEKKPAQVLSIAGDMANIMDSENFETMDLAIPEDLKGAIVEGAEVIYWIILGEKVLKEVRGGK